MDEQDLALNNGEQTPGESPTTEQTPEEAIGHEFSSTTPEAVEEEIAETEGEPKKGFQSRVRELNQRAKAAEEKAKSLEDKLAELTGSVEPSGATHYAPQVNEGDEITPERYQQDVAKTADALVTLRIKQSEAVNRINNEARDVVRAYPQLDPTSDSFDKELSETITEAVEAKVKANPYNASVRGFVDKLMKPFARAVDNQVGQATENIARQVSEAALRPTNVRKVEKTAGEKSIAELEAELGVVQV